MLFSPSTPSEGGIYGLDKAVHASLFAALAFTAVRRYGRRGAVLLPLLAYSPVSEVLQAVLPIHRDGSFADAVADLVGVLIAWSWVSRHPQE